MHQLLELPDKAGFSRMNRACISEKQLLLSTNSLNDITNKIDFIIGQFRG